MIKLYQQVIATLADTIKVRMAIDKTKHAKERQSRDQSRFITNQEITQGIQSAVKLIAQNLMLDNIDIGNYVCIINKKFKPALNIVGVINKVGNTLEFVVVTIMQKDGFYPKSGTYKFEIR